jgi:hypothetical protein
LGRRKAGGGESVCGGSADATAQQVELSDQRRRCAGRRISGERIDNVKATGRKNFTKIEENRVQQDRGNRRSYANVGYLADAAGGFVMPVGVGVGGDLQEKEKRKQR